MVQSVTDALDHIGHHQPFMENILPSAIQQFTGLPLEELIGSSLKATEKAEAALAMYMTRFLKEQGLKVSPDSILIKMNLEYPQPDSSDADVTSGDEHLATTFHISLTAVIPMTNHQASLNI